GRVKAAPPQSSTPADRHGSQMPAADNRHLLRDTHGSRARVAGQLASPPRHIGSPLLRWTDWQRGFDGRTRAAGIDVETATELPHTLAHPRNADSRFPPSRLQRLQHGLRNASTLVAHFEGHRRVVLGQTYPGHPAPGVAHDVRKALLGNPK